MTGSEKYTWGVILSVSGGVAISGGILLSATLVGACLGVPMAIVGLPLMIWGAIWAYQGRFQKQQEVISAGIRDGIASVHAANMNPVYPAIAASGAPAIPTELAQNSASFIPQEPNMTEEDDAHETDLDSRIKDDAKEGEALPS